jgi:hypothetical protein
VLAFELPLVVALDEQIGIRFELGFEASAVAGRRPLQLISQLFSDGVVFI